MARHIVGIALLAIAACILATANGQEIIGPRCRVNEVWSLCGRLCEPTCSNPYRNPLFCPRIQCSRYTSGCRCQDNYYRASDGSCVLLQQCQQYGQIRRPQQQQQQQYY